MNDKSVRQTEKLVLIATIVIFVLLFFLRTTSNPFLFSSPARAKAARLVKATEVGPPPPYQEGQLPEQEKENPLVAVRALPDEAARPLWETAELLELPAGSELYSMGQATRRNFRVRVQVSNKGKTSSSNIRVDVPLMGNLDSPYQVLLKESFSHEPLAVNELSQGSRTASFSIPYLAPGEAETIVVDYFLHVTPLTATLAGPSEYYSHLGQGSSDPVYLMPADKIESNHPEIAAKAREISSGLTGDLEKARAFFSFVISYLQYDLNSPNRNKGALSALRGRSGVCEDYASLFVALCRAEGIPARLVNGYADPRGRGDIWNVAPGETFSLKGYRHSWAEFYTPKTGWIPVDPTLNIYDRNLTYFASLPQASHLAQNYQDQNMRVRYQGGQLAVAWGEELTG